MGEFVSSETIQMLLLETPSTIVSIIALSALVRIVRMLVAPIETMARELSSIAKEMSTVVRDATVSVSDVNRLSDRVKEIENNNRATTAE